MHVCSLNSVIIIIASVFVHCIGMTRLMTSSSLSSTKLVSLCLRQMDHMEVQCAAQLTTPTTPPPVTPCTGRHDYKHSSILSYEQRTCLSTNLTTISIGEEASLEWGETIINVCTCVVCMGKRSIII